MVCFLLVKFVSSVFEKLTNGSTEEPVNQMETTGIILVAGATGGVGRRVVDILRKRGLPVKALVPKLSIKFLNACALKMWVKFITFVGNFHR